MKYLHRNINVVLFFILMLIPVGIVSQNDEAIEILPEIISTSEATIKDSLKTVQDSIYNEIVKPKPVYIYTIFKNSSPADSIIFENPVILKHKVDSLVSIPISRSDSLLYASNPLILPLVYIGKDLHQIWNGETRMREWLYPQKKSIFQIDTTKNLSTEYLVADLRTNARKYIANNSIGLYVTTMDRLPHLSSFMSRPIQGKKLEKLNIYDDKIVLNSNKIEYENVKRVYWIKRANAMLQFSQNYVSPNWHQGGNRNLAFLSVFLTEFNYDNGKNVQWDNKIEWRAGFNSVDGDTLRKISTNDDLLRYISKFGVKAGGNWYYSISGEFTSHLFNSYRGVNSNVLKTSLLTPVRANIGVGMDYKYKKIFSLMIAPVSFKYIYMNDTVNVNPNSFGIKKGENQLKQIGSSLLAQLNYSPMMNWDITSKFTFYTDYKKFEADLEIVNDFTINRFLSARLLVNPRYDNTVIMKGGEKAQIQLKELLSVGFSYRFF